MNRRNAIKALFLGCAGLFAFPLLPRKSNAGELVDVRRYVREFQPKRLYLNGRDMMDEHAFYLSRTGENGWADCWVKRDGKFVTNNAGEPVSKRFYGRVEFR